MNKSEAINELSSALARAQAEMKNPAFDSNNPHFRSKYASLASVRDTVMPVLAKHGLSIVQMPVFEDGKAGCETMLMHSSGQYISERLLIPVDKATAHGVASATTYSRRISMQAFAGVVGDDDDDGNAAVNSKPVSTSKPVLAAPITPTTGAWDAVAPERKEIVRRIGEGVIELLNAGAMDDAYAALFTEAKDAGRIDNDEFVALWDMLKGMSKERRALKEMRDARTKEKAA